MQHFIQTANQLGQQKSPFFFLIDFEQQKPIICPLEQAAASGLFFDFFANRMFNHKTLASRLNFKSIPFRLKPISKVLSLFKRKSKPETIIY